MSSVSWDARWGRERGGEEERGTNNNQHATSKTGRTDRQRMRRTDVILVVSGQTHVNILAMPSDLPLSQVVGGELEPEEKEELAEKIGKLLQRDRMGVRTQLGFCWAGASSYVLSASTSTSRQDVEEFTSYVGTLENCYRETGRG